MIAGRARFALNEPIDPRDALAAELDQIAAAVRALPGLSRHKPEAFLEAKSELAGRMIRRAAELRTAMPRQPSPPRASA